VRVNRTSIEKDTKTHQMRRLALDPATVEVLTEHPERYDALCRELGVEPRESAYLFSYRPAHDRPSDPNGVTHRYANQICHSIRETTDGGTDSVGSRLPRLPSIPGLPAADQKTHGFGERTRSRTDCGRTP
jgi:hypothetical protein